MKKTIFFFFIFMTLIMLMPKEHTENITKTEILLDDTPVLNTDHVIPYHREVKLDVIIISKLNGTCYVCTNSMNATSSPSCIQKKVMYGKNTFEFVLFPEQDTTRMFVEYQVSCEFVHHLQKISVSMDELVIVKIMRSRIDKERWKQGNYSYKERTREDAENGY